MFQSSDPGYSSSASKVGFGQDKHFDRGSGELGLDVLVMFIVTWNLHWVRLIEAVPKLSDLVKSLWKCSSMISVLV